MLQGDSYLATAYVVVKAIVSIGLWGGATVGWLLGKSLFDWPRENALSKTESGVIALAGVLLHDAGGNLDGGCGGLMHLLPRPRLPGSRPVQGSTRCGRL